MRLLAVIAAGLVLVGLLVFLIPRRTGAGPRQPEVPAHSEHDLADEQGLLISPEQLSARRPEPSRAITPSAMELPTVSGDEDSWISIQGFVPARSGANEPVGKAVDQCSRFPCRADARAGRD